MQGEFTAFLTLDETNRVYIELYTFEHAEITLLCEPFFLVDSAPYEHMETIVSSSRQMIAVILYNKEASKVTQFKSFIIDFRKFNEEEQRISEIAVNEVDISVLIENGSKPIYDVHLLYVNETMKSYTQELIVLLETDTPE